MSTCRSGDGCARPVTADRGSGKFCEVHAGQLEALRKTLGKPPRGQRRRDDDGLIAPPPPTTSEVLEQLTAALKDGGPKTRQAAAASVGMTPGMARFRQAVRRGVDDGVLSERADGTTTIISVV